MADPFGSGNSDRDIDKVLIALKKGAQLLKYGRKGKPKFCPFRLSNDESSLIWLSSEKEKALKLTSVSKIIPGQRTAVFQRYLCREKEYLSFSLIHSNGKRSLDVICKDKAEAEVWFAGLKALIASVQSERSKIDGWNDEGIHFEDSRELSSNSFSGSSISSLADDSSLDSSINTNNLHKDDSFEKSVFPERSDVASMYTKGASSDVFRVSVSSAHSTSSQDDAESLGDVYLWGEVICDRSTRASSEECFGSSSSRSDVLLPRPLESNTILDVQYVACGVRHAAIITRQGEVFTWGEESGGILGHGIGTDAIHPRLVESLTFTHADLVACGEYHSCAVTDTGELYTWGDGMHNAGLLGHGNDVSHCIPKRVSGPLEGLQIAFVTCGTWHTALINSSGQLFTFGDGTFGALGHGNTESISYPRVVETLMGLKTITVACGVWHTAAVVEVTAMQFNVSISSGKLFTWGDGDKYRLGHGDKETRLNPTCVSSLIDYNFYKIACGHSLTVGLTTSGRVLTMGSAVYGQLGNPKSDGKSPCFVEDKLSNECVVEVSCGSYHIAVLTARKEVYSWGKGANGRLGHGDIEDRKTPTLIEALKDRPVKQIACGSNFTAAICQHKWVSGAEQSQCSSCRQAFGFTRKKHNCYNCGLVHCHSCSSKKALRAALSPNPAKPYRVCDSCYLKLSRVVQPNSVNNKKTSAPYLLGENKERNEKTDVKTTKMAIFSNLDLIMHLDMKAAKQGKKTEPFIRAPQISSFAQVQKYDFSAASNAAFMTMTQTVNNSRAVSPFSRRPSPPRSATPTPVNSDSSLSKSVNDGLKEANEALHQEVQKLRAQVESLRKKCELQELELRKSASKAQEATELATEESTKSKAAKEVMKSLTSQLKDMAEKLPAAVYDNDDNRILYIPNGNETHVHHSELNENFRSIKVGNSPHMLSSTPHSNKLSNQMRASRPQDGSNEISMLQQNQKSVSSTGREDHIDMARQNGGLVTLPGNKTEIANGIEANVLQNSEKDSNLRSLTVAANHQVESEWLEQYEPGVYITLVALQDGTRDLKRVRFSRRRFGEHQAETWWSENRVKVYEKYNVRTSDKTPVEAANQSGRHSGGFPQSPHVW